MKKLILATLMLSTPWTSLADTNAEQKGLEIARESDVRDRGFGDYRATLTMVLRNTRGQTSVRKLKMSIKETSGDGDKTLVVFDEPGDVKGTSLLTYAHKTGDDDQWLFIPSLKRVKRIASSNKSASFMGSEFSYEDLVSQEVGKFTYRYVGEDSLDTVRCHVIDRYPVSEDSGYRRQRVWMDKSDFKIHKVDYYDRKDSLLKTLTPTDYRLYMGKYWRASGMLMTNHQTGKNTQLIWENYHFGAGLGDADFTQQVLVRGH